MVEESMTSMLAMPQVPLVCAGVTLLFLNEFLQRPKLEIYVRPGVGAFGVGLICIRSVPPGACICECTAEFSDRVSALRLNMLRPSVRRTVLELFDGYDSSDGTYSVPTKYDQAIPISTLARALAASALPRPYQILRPTAVPLGFDGRRSAGRGARSLIHQSQ